MEKKNNITMVRALGLTESISMTVGTVVGVGLFTCGSAQIGIVGKNIIWYTLIAFIISIFPAIIYGELATILPYSGGTYQYAKYGLNKFWANLAGWHYIISIVAITSGEALAFANYFQILLSQFGIHLFSNQTQLIAIVLIVIFLILNIFGVKVSSRAQNAFMFFFWGCSILWFIYMIPNINLSYLHGNINSNNLSLTNMIYILGLVWWCYTGFETCVSMGDEIKYPQITIPRALKLSIVIVFICNALFQWFLLGIVPSKYYHSISIATAPYAEGLQLAGYIGFPIILLCVGIAFGGDLSTINPGIAAPARYIYTMSKDNVFPLFFSKIGEKSKVPYNAIILIGVINIFLILTNSIIFIASVSLVSLAICYIIGCCSYIGMKIKYPSIRDMFKIKLGSLYAGITIFIYLFVILFSEKSAIFTSLLITLLCFAFYFVLDKNRLKTNKFEMVSEYREQPNDDEKIVMDRQYAIWKLCTIILATISVLLYVVF